MAPNERTAARRAASSLPVDLVSRGRVVLEEQGGAYGRELIGVEVALRHHVTTGFHAATRERAGFPRAHVLRRGIAW
jgi:hypothetical protein